MEFENKIWLDDVSLGYVDDEENTFDKDKYIDDIFGYQERLYEIITEERNDYHLVSLSEIESVYFDINDYVEEHFDNWEEERFIRYIRYLKKLVGEDK